MFRGIDISSYQSGLKIQKNNGYDFVILRGGFTGWGTGVSYNKDTCFENFYNQCKNNDIPVGVYWYSCANNYEKGVNEANFLYNNCLKGKQFEYPIYIDVEENRHQMVGKNLVADAIRGFCETLESKGYYVGIYANLNYFNNYIDTPSLSMYDKWLAYWTNNSNKPSFPYGEFGLWQNSDSGNVSGYRIDTDISYIDYPSLIKSKGFNGYSKSTDTNQDNNQNISNKKSNEEIAKEVINGKYGNYPERKTKLESEGYNYQEIQNIVNQMLGITISKTLTVGTKVKAISTGNGASDGSSNTAKSGITGTISRIIKDAKYPYLVSNNGTPIGWYKESALNIIG